MGRDSFGSDAAVNCKTLHDFNIVVIQFRIVGR